MSTDTGRFGQSRDEDGPELARLLRLDVDAVRLVALAGVGLLVTAYASVFHEFMTVAGDPDTFLALAVGVLVAATALSGVLRVRTATILAVGGLATGLALYVVSLPKTPPLGPLVTDAVGLATGRSMLLITNVDVWVFAVAPAPLFLTWYLALRRWYVGSVLVGGATLSFLVLTGDATNITALLGVLGGIVAVAVGDMDRRGDSLAAAEPLAILLAATILLSGLAPVVPGGSGGTADSWTSFQDGGSGPSTIEGSLVGADEELGIQGSLSLSPTVRFRVQSDEEAYWRVGSYDRFTGQRWLRTGDSRGYSGAESGPPGRSRTVRQTVTLYDDLRVLPAAWKPVSVGSGVADQVRVTEQGGFQLSGSLSANESYTVRSRVPEAGPRTLRAAGTNYSDSVASRYTELPANTPDRVGETTSRLTANADNPYETAQVVERWLENHKSYSLDVDRPDGNVAAKFLFDMDAGYCTYFATTMVTMLRTQDIPARFVVGYTAGERVASDEWVVRGYNAHAWVEAYFPDVGWVRFDPTPSGPREQVEQQTLADARTANQTDVDLNDTGGTEWTPTPTVTPAPLTPRPNTPVGRGPNVVSPTPITPPDVVTPGRPGIGTVGGTIDFNGTVTGANGTVTGDGAGSSGPFGGLPDPSREEAALGSIFLIGVAVGLRRTGVTGRVYRAIWLRYQPREDPRTDAERAFERLEYVLAERYRPRRDGETARQYLAAIGADERARAVSEIRERAHYAGEVSREEADQAISIVDEIVSG